MNSTKTLALVAMTALSLGVGSAMAQSSAVSPNYAAPQASAPQTTAPVVRSQQTTVQYGSSDHNFGPTGPANTDPIGGGF